MGPYAYGGGVGVHRRDPDAPYRPVMHLVGGSGARSVVDKVGSVGRDYSKAMGKEGASVMGRHCRGSAWLATPSSGGCP